MSLSEGNSDSWWSWTRVEIFRRTAKETRLHTIDENSHQVLESCIPWRKKGLQLRLAGFQ